MKQPDPQILPPEPSKTFVEKECARRGNSDTKTFLYFLTGLVSGVILHATNGKGR